MNMTTINIKRPESTMSFEYAIHKPKESVDSAFNPVSKKVIDVEVKGTLPVHGSEQAAGYDLRIKEPVVIPPKESRLIATQTSVAVPEGVAVIGMPRSSICKLGLMQLNSIGLIDSDYRGVIHFPYMNISDEPVTLLADERIGQIMFIEHLTARFTEVEEFSTETKRGTGGIGSSGRV